MKKKNSIGISAFGFENKESYPIYVSKKCYKEKHVVLLLMGKESKGHSVLIKDFDTFIYDHTLFCEKKNTFLLLLFTSFKYRRNIKISY